MQQPTVGLGQVDPALEPELAADDLLRIYRYMLLARLAEVDESEEELRSAIEKTRAELETTQKRWRLRL